MKNKIVYQILGGEWVDAPEEEKNMPATLNFKSSLMERNIKGGSNVIKTIKNARNIQNKDEIDGFKRSQAAYLRKLFIDYKL